MECVTSHWVTLNTPITLTITHFHIHFSSLSPRAQFIIKSWHKDVSSLFSSTSDCFHFSLRCCETAYRNIFSVRFTLFVAVLCLLFSTTVRWHGDITAGKRPQTGGPKSNLFPLGPTFPIIQQDSIFPYMPPVTAGWSLRVTPLWCHFLVLWTPALKPWVWHYCRCHLGFWIQEWPYLEKRVELRKIFSHLSINLSITRSTRP